MNPDKWPWSVTVRCLRRALVARVMQAGKLGIQIAVSLAVKRQQVDWSVGSVVTPRGSSRVTASPKQTLAHQNVVKKGNGQCEDCSEGKPKLTLTALRPGGV